MYVNTLQLGFGSIRLSQASGYRIVPHQTIRMSVCTNASYTFSMQFN